MRDEIKSITNAFDVDIAQTTAVAFILIVFIICATIIVGIYLDRHYKNKKEEEDAEKES